MKNIPQEVCCGNLSLILHLYFNGVMVTNFVSHSFPCFDDLKLDSTITMATRVVSFDLIFCKFSEKVNFVDYQHGDKVFDF